MKKFKFFSLVLTVTFLFSMTVSADFSDMPQDETVRAAIENAVNGGFLSGYEDGTVRPGNYITRAEMASIITRACGTYNIKDISAFEDVTPDKWFYDAFQKAYYMGAFKGDGAGHFNPDSNITNQETFTVLSQVFELLPTYKRVYSVPDPLPENTIFKNPCIYDISALNNYPDSAEVADWAKIYVAGNIERGALSGDRIRPTEYTTRGEFAVIMSKIVGNYIDSPGVYTELPEGNVIIRSNGVVLDGVSTDHSIIIADGVRQGQVLLRNDVKANRLIVRGCAALLDDEGIPVNENFGIIITGTYDYIGVIGPNIVADVSKATYKGLHSGPTTSINTAVIEDEQDAQK